MSNEYHIGYQYDRCTSRGICSINPTTSSLQEVILIYLKLAAKYSLKLEECGNKDKNIRNLILNTISVLSSNYEISEINFEMINSVFKSELPKIVKNYNEKCADSKSLDTDFLLKSENCLNDYIRYGEKEFNKRYKNIDLEIRNLYQILFILIKSISINILTYESFGKELDEEVTSVIKVLNLLNSNNKSTNELKDIILDISKKDCNLMKKIREIQEENYGKQDEFDVSFSTTKGKAILVVGSNIKELEEILNVFENKEIDVYTHDNMVLAHTFPKFRNYKSLKGQYGQGIENCLLDFSTFPGPIIITKHSMFNIENLYRGRLFTTDFSYSKGVIPIKNNDYTEVINIAKDSKGFKTGKLCNSIKIGFSLEKTIDKIDKKLNEKIYNQIVLIGIGGYSADENEYFKVFIKNSPSNVLIISMFHCESRDNIICINAENDTYGMSMLLEKILTKYSEKITIIYPYTDRHTLSVIINSTNIKNNNTAYVGKWNQIIMNPNVIECLKKEFDIKELSLPKKDMNIIFDVK